MLLDNETGVPFSMSVTTLSHKVAGTAENGLSLNVPCYTDERPHKTVSLSPASLTISYSGCFYLSVPLPTGCRPYTYFSGIFADGTVCILLFNLFPPMLPSRYLFKGRVSCASRDPEVTVNLIRSLSLSATFAEDEASLMAVVLSSSS